MAKRLSDNIVATNGNGSRPQLSAEGEFPMPLEESIFVELSTGRVVEMVIGELSMFYELGEIPDELKGIAAKILFATVKDDIKEIEKRYFDRLKLARWTVGKVLRNNVVPLNRFFHEEIFEIYNMGNDPARAMENFRLFQESHVGLVHELQDVGGQTEPVVESATAA